MNKPKKVKVIYHYDEQDKDYCEDYYSVDLYFDKTKILSLSDDYHDGSFRQIEGFLTACKLFWPDFPEVEIIKKNDFKN